MSLGVRGGCIKSAEAAADVGVPGTRDGMPLTPLLTPLLTPTADAAWTAALAAASTAERGDGPDDDASSVGCAGEEW